MTTKSWMQLSIAGLMASSVAAPVYAMQEKTFVEQASSEAKYTPGDFKPAPDNMKTRFGTLEFPGGYPTEEAVQQVYNELDRQRATQLYLDMYPALSAHGLLKGWVRDYGMTDTSDIVVMANRLDSAPLILTGNTESLYSFFVLDMKANGPIVLEVPPGVMGPIDDHNFLFLADVGPTGQDKGKGGKYLILPPDYKGEVPDGYFVVKSPTYGVWNFGRGFLKDGDPKPALKNIKANVRVYPLSKADNPPKTEFINASGINYNTVSPATYNFFEDINQVIQDEPIDSLEPEKRGVLKSIGIEKGKPFKPDARMKRILTDSANISNAAFRSLWWRPRDDANALYKGTESRWMNGYPDRNTTFIKDGAMLLDARTQMYTIGTGVTPAMATVTPGEG